MMRALLDTDSPRPGALGAGLRSRVRKSATSRKGAKPATSRGTTSGGSDGSGGDRPDRFTIRTRWAVVFVVLAVLAIAARLVVVHTVESKTLAAQAAAQREFTQVLTAKRGAILDRNGRPLAYTDEARALTFLPQAVRAATEAAHQRDPKLPDAATRFAAIAKGVSSALGGSISEADLLAKLNGQDKFVYLARSVATDVAARIVADYPEVGADPEDLRVYPGGSLAANVVGDVNYDGNGLIGLESSMDSVLGGTNGSKTFDRGSDGAVIPGSARNVAPAINGATLRLTLDSDIQWFVQSQVYAAKAASGAKRVAAVVLDAKTGEVLAMANDSTFDASRPLSQQRDASLDNPAVTTPFEPGSVNKIITAAAAIEYGVTRPETTHLVPGYIRMAGVTVKDAWAHGTERYTTAGIFGKSSNVGTLMLARKVGDKRFADMVAAFGLGQRTGVSLPGESPGQVPALSQWSGGSFANLPIGQGLSMTLLQMTSAYQAIANDGVRIPPRIIAAETRDGHRESPMPTPDGITVVSPQTARTVRDMFRAVVQDDPTGRQRGTGPAAAVPGYQVSGKTGTAQQVDPHCNCYSDSRYNITFAGIAPADDPRYVIGLIMDNPRRSSDGSGGQSAAPLFGTIAGWLLQRARVPYSPPAPRLTLEAG
ncbi:MAG TPA: penicillin-binding protein 2 [Gordonia sp. (in: high G+C Gram-positive bacteria)]|uniref:peptidoglycan D,D-transpeptidase FtsI family protein n=1 Tax=unclassified Gordonia (in: high G+C Gram-positive bacteria) TaxID=2657482 RepID=UPI0025C4A159|nr:MULTISPECIES: penicillin-binding protein 2 [unclassified Gordonia (in: high G+C Gram-positive bacteria)]HNP58966.1 penicillin-binding protein 2 [Gordonia sp. (in: high G+C Gram-positive bacteria)]HRC52739.1 penicillin-binding protein 2 [Gordonia sp. (in: high G+C Gram-positive bacteria)]